MTKYFSGQREFLVFSTLVLEMDEHGLADAFRDPMMMGLGAMVIAAGAYMAIVMQVQCFNSRHDNFSSNCFISKGQFQTHFSQLLIECQTKESTRILEKWIRSWPLLKKKFHEKLSCLELKHCMCTVIHKRKFFEEPKNYVIQKPKPITNLGMLKTSFYFIFILYFWRPCTTK